MRSEKLWVEKYRPKTVEECILPESIKSNLKSIIESGNIPNLLFYGSAGVGKTTIAYALCNQLDYEYLYVNASNEGRSIDTVRTTIAEFCTGMSLSGRKKIVILDEFCGVPSITQDALKGFFEQFSASCSFILTANHKHKINEPIRSRFSEIDFTIRKEEAPALGVQFMKRIVEICTQEKIKADKRAIAELVKKFFPDFRKTINELQKFSASGEFTEDSLKLLESPTEIIIQYLKTKNFKELRRVVATTSHIDTKVIARELYNDMYNFVVPSSIPNFIVIIADYQYKSSFAVDQEINLMAMFVELMGNIEFKD